MFVRSLLAQSLRQFNRISSLKIRQEFVCHQKINVSTTIPIPKYHFGEDPFKPVWRWDVLTTILIFLGVIEDLEKRDTPLVLEIKRGILARQRRQYFKAEQHFHAALKMAQDQKYADAETYIFDCMADNCFEQDEFVRARDLYLEVINRLQDKLSSTELVELSCKLAFCYSNIGSQSDAELGFQFAIDTIRLQTTSFYDEKKGIVLVQEMDDLQKNSLALLGMCYDFYSKHLEDIHLKYSLQYKLKALKISSLVNGDKEQQTLVLHNDIASIYAQMEQYDQAKNNLSIAIQGAKEIELTELPVFYVNLAAIHHKENRIDLAKEQCKKAQDFLNKYKTAFTQIEMKQLFDKCEHCIKGEKFY